MGFKAGRAQPLAMNWRGRCGGQWHPTPVSSPRSSLVPSMVPFLPQVATSTPAGLSSGAALHPLDTCSSLPDDGLLCCPPNEGWLPVALH